MFFLYRQQIASATRYLHRNRIVHHDIKGDNIFVDVDGTCVLGDFGLAARMPEGQSTVPVYKCGGTKAYMAPELLGPESTKHLHVDPFLVSEVHNDVR